MSLHPSITDAQLAESAFHCSRCGISEKDLSKKGKILLRCAGCKWTRYCSVECQQEEWPTHRVKCHVNAATARALANDPTKHPSLLTDFRAWLSVTIETIAWATLNALEAKTKYCDLNDKAFIVELVHVPRARETRKKFVLKKCAVRERDLVSAAVASDAAIAREFEKMSGKTTVAAAVVKAGALVKVIGFDVGSASLAAHVHCDDWKPLFEQALNEGALLP